jgi:hypothetical protein
MMLDGKQLWSLVRALQAAGDWDRAERAARVMRDSLSAESPSATSDADMSMRLRMVASHSLGDAARVHDRMEEADRLHREGLKISRERVRTGGAPSARRDLIFSLD